MYKTLPSNTSKTTVLILFSLILQVPFINHFSSFNIASAQATPPWPTTPPAQICNNTAVLDGPSTAPSGAVTVNVGDNLENLTEASPAGTTFWLAPGTHTFTYSVIPKDGNTYIGAPGAIIDGDNTINTAFWEEFYGRKAKDVTLSHLTIQNFASSGQDQGSVYAGEGWNINHSTFKNHGYIALFAGPDNVIEDNCFDSNGQLAIGTYRFDNETSNVIINHNEIKNNNTKNLQACGCGGGVKWWTMKHGQFTNNWVHNNKGPGVWGDTNNIEMLFEGNYINDNDGMGIFYETSYNFLIRNNTLIRNALVHGAASNGNFPIAAIYISESGGINESGYLYSNSEIYNNYLEDNWDGVALWESGNRYASNEVSGYTPAFGDPIHWKTQNVSVHDNEFHMDKSVAGCENNPNCGRNGLFSDWVAVPGGDPEAPNTANNQYQLAVTFDQNNLFNDNHYFGSWQFVAYDKDLSYDWTTWRNPKPNPTSSFLYYSPGNYGFGQDLDSTIDGVTPTPTSTPTPTITTTPTPTVTPTPTPTNIITGDTANLEESVGQWSAWYNVLLSNDTTEAHTGDHSLKVDAEDSYWGISTSNWPGFAATGGNKTISFWGKLTNGTNNTTIMTVHWLDASYQVLQTDTLSLTGMTNSWQKVEKAVIAPSGTATALVQLNGSGSSDSLLYLDDFSIQSATLPQNILDTDTSSFDASIGQWTNWYSTELATSTEKPHSGTKSMLVTLTGGQWGFSLNNWPGFSTTAGTKTVSYYALKGAGTTMGITMSLLWMNTNGEVLQTDQLSIAELSDKWQRAETQFTAPTGTTSVLIRFNNSGNTGNTFYIDDIILSE